MERSGLTPGSEIGGYTIVAPLGSGGMGTVYRAVDGGGEQVALKLLHPHVASDTVVRARLLREVSALQRLRHPAVAAVLDAEADSTEAFIVTELVDGRTLAERVRADGALPADELATFAERLRAALAAVHGAGVVHRDLKPSNVLLTADGPVLIDFGLAQGVDDDANLTTAGFVLGTPGYLAPELLDGGDPSPATDLWGWAALVAFAATGRDPFGTRPVEAVLARARSGEVDLTGLGPLTTAAIAGALRPDPADRTDAAEVTAALRTVADEGEQEPGDVPTVALGAGAAGVSALAGTRSAGGPEDEEADDDLDEDGTDAVGLDGTDPSDADEDDADEDDDDADGTDDLDSTDGTADADEDDADEDGPTDDPEGDVELGATADRDPADDDPAVADDGWDEDGWDEDDDTALAHGSVEDGVETTLVARRDAAGTVALPTASGAAAVATADVPVRDGHTVAVPVREPATAGAPSAAEAAAGAHPGTDLARRGAQVEHLEVDDVDVEGPWDGDAGDLADEPEEEGDWYTRPPARRRWGSLLAIGLVVATAATLHPAVTLLVVLALVVLVRTVGLTVESMHGRRERRGVRRGDVPLAIVSVPWYLLRAVLGTLPAALVASAVMTIVGGVGWYLLDTGTWALDGAAPGERPHGLTVQLLVGALVLLGVVLLWWGPLSRMTRTGARRTLAAVAPGPVGALVVVVLALVVALVLFDRLVDAQPLSWWPLSDPQAPGP